ncbi:hypothetical protein [Solibacillus daqui]|uniref:hypothetical protein n=1 Tax=Solibacillus daqui TaxID=2912187 RepID=UPI002367285E|nr:hypothetical protein [Solibacillus daqui]
MILRQYTFELLPVERLGVITSISWIGNGNSLIFTDVMLNISGEDIDPITYTINKGMFIEDVTLTAEEVKNKDRLLSEKIYTISSEPNSALFQGIKEIGSTFTVQYNEQDQYQYSLAIPHDGNKVEDDIIISVVAKYADGNSEQQNIVVNQESSSISLLLKLN